MFFVIVLQHVNSNIYMQIEEIGTEVCDIVQEAVIKPIPKKKKFEKAKWLSEEALKIAGK